MQSSRFLLLAVFIAGLGGANRGLAADTAALRTDYASRTTRLFEIAVHRYVGSPSGEILERRYLLDARGVYTFVEDTTVPASVAIPLEAFDKVLISASAWIAYRQLGPHAFANFELTTEVPILIADRQQFEVRVSEYARVEPGKLLNLSTRSYASRDEKLVAGFVVSEQSRRVLVRAVGPSLAQFGVTGFLADPFVTIYRGNLPHYFNGDWGSRYDAHETAGAAGAVGAFPLPGGSKDAALVVELEPGAYTVHVEPETGAGGEVLVEVYSLP
jgi:hypothetical protein